MTNQSLLLSDEQKQNLAQALEQPLTGRSVLIPITGKAFMVGELKPILNNEKQELVELNGIQMERSQAYKSLVSSMSTTAKATATTTTNKSTSQSTSNTRNNENDNPINFATKSEENPTNTEQLPIQFMEIQEFYDESGKQVQAKAVDITKQLDTLLGKSNKPPPTVTPIPTGSGTKLDNIDDNNDPKPNVTNEEYDKLAARLDELARLEEQAEASQKVNKKSSKKLQSSSWNKGFLNQKPKKSKTTSNNKKVTTSKVAQAKEDISNPSTALLLQSSSATTTTSTGTDQVNKSLLPPPTPVATPASGSDVKKSVAFGTNQVKEIPKIGERSVASLERPPSNNKPLESSLFSGVIRERNVEPTMNVPSIMTRPTSSGQSSSSSSSNNDKNAPTKKKKSRFAQERQQYSR